MCRLEQAHIRFPNTHLSTWIQCRKDQVKRHHPALCAGGVCWLQKRLFPSPGLIQVAVITTRKSRGSISQFPTLSLFVIPMDQAEINNWKSIAESMEAKGETQSWFYLRARAIAEGKPDPMPNISELTPESV